MLYKGDFQAGSPRPELRTTVLGYNFAFQDKNQSPALYFTETNTHSWRKQVSSVPAGQLSCGVRDLLPHVLVLGKPNPNVAQAICDC